MSREIADNMGIMLDMELAIEAKARREGEKEGRKEGIAEGIMGMGPAAKQARPFVLKKLEDYFGDPEKARIFFDERVAAHPEGSAYLDCPKSESAGKTPRKAWKKRGWISRSLGIVCEIERLSGKNEDAKPWIGTCETVIQSRQPDTKK